MIGIVIKRPNRFGSPPFMYIHSISEGLRTNVDLCRGCAKWNSGVGNCVINESYRTLELKVQTRSIRTMCPEFVDRRIDRQATQEH